MEKTKFITIPETFIVSIEKENGYALLTLKDNTLILKVDKESIINSDSKNLIAIGTKIEFIKGSPPKNIDKRVETEIHEFTECPGYKRYCLNKLTICCTNQFIVGQCEGTWSDC